MRKKQSVKANKWHKMLELAEKELSYYNRIPYVLKKIENGIKKTQIKILKMKTTEWDEKYTTWD